jgi:hypothetical protein
LTFKSPVIVKASFKPELVPIPTFPLVKTISLPIVVHCDEDVPVIVSFLFDESVVRVIPVPAANVSVSVLLLASISDWPLTAIFLKMFCALPGSVLPEAEIVVPLIEMPVPAVRVTAPVLPWKERTPVLVIVGVWPAVIPIPFPAFNE